MYQFINDYSDGCHPKILEALSATNHTIQEGYGDDSYSQEAKELLKQEMQCDTAEIYFVSGGTQANLTIISSLLKPYEAVIAAQTGHINVHEAGAIEATGHKVCSVFSEDGKLTVAQIENILAQHEDPPHMVKPKLVYLSNATEIGSVYNKTELKTIHDFCKKQQLLLFVDGARLGAAIMAKAHPISLVDMARHTDIFYIGGTKNGALLGEAIVIPNQDLQTDFAYNIKQKGALLAKGRLLGIQFLTLFKEGLYYELAQHSNIVAMQLAQVIMDANYQLSQPAVSNQIFPIFPDQLAKIIQEKYHCYTWKRLNNNHTVLRMVCSWATPPEAIEDVKRTLEKFVQ